MRVGRAGSVRYFCGMSVAEIKDELRHLSPEERREIALALIELNESQNSAPRQATSFAEAKAYVFDNYGDLLKRIENPIQHREISVFDPSFKAAVDQVFIKHRELLKRLAE